jgi:hypothetical protein
LIELTGPKHPNMREYPTFKAAREPDRP